MGGTCLHLHSSGPSRINFIYLLLQISLIELDKLSLSFTCWRALSETSSDWSVRILRGVVSSVGRQGEDTLFWGWGRAQDEYMFRVPPDRLNGAL